MRKAYYLTSETLAPSNFDFDLPTGCDELQQLGIARKGAELYRNRTLTLSGVK